MTTEKPVETLKPVVYNAPPTHLLSPQFRWTPSGTDIRATFQRAREAIEAAGGQKRVATK